MKNIFLIILFSILIISCEKKTQTVINNIWDNISFNNTLSNSTQIIIKVYDSTLTNKRINVESYTPVKELKTVIKKQVENFETIFIKSEKTGYCCCPKSTYSIHFRNQKEELDFFYVDTLEFKNKIRIFEKSYQYSYIIEKQKWKNFINEIDKK
ncbi:hypothetical protein B0A80_15630 [Flavobacterium tructae]|uniref:hypothetical protein n=1 Tax=Flavobacterium tructae TaxID=1114873 RepID=UPI000B5BFF8A|nr:hypothetical protein [Flavobacterium tructae]OXB22538.1 hypothetical protein B0A80_15630 [Flavobacterium tructae]